jgi:succinoglycan biosynthesis transport protein ExoP
MAKLPKHIYEGGSQGVQADDAPMFSMTRVIGILRRNVLLIGAIVAIALLAGLVLTLLATPKYRAVATIQIDQQVEQIIEDRTAQDSSDSERFLQTQLDILRSRSLALRVAQRLNLLNGGDFVSRMTAGKGEAAVDPTKRRAQIVNLLRSNLEAELPRSSRIVGVAFVSPVAGLAQQVANAYVTEFVRANLQRKYDSSAYARDFLRNQLAETKQQVEQGERALNDYARRNQIVRTEQRLGGDSGGASGNSLVGSSLNQVNAALVEARAARIAVEGRWTVTRGNSLFSIPAVLGNSTIQSLLQQRATAETLLQQERSRRLPDHPAVIQARRQVEALTGQLNTIAQNIRSSIEQEYAAALRRETELSNDLDKYRQASLFEQDRSVQYNILSREAGTARSLYASLLDRYNQLSATAGVSLNNLSVVDYADVPGRPYSPNLVVNLAFALIAGLVLAAVVVLLREQADEVMRSPSDLPRELGVATLGSLPLLPTNQDVLDHLSDPKSSINEAVSSIRTALMHASSTGVPSILFLTSTMPGEGKSITSYALSVSLAHLGKRTLLVGADLRRPSLHHLLNLPNSHGLSDILSSNALAEDVTIEGVVDNLDIILGGPPPPNPSDLLAGPGLQRFLAEQVAKYDVIVIDGPPVLGLADAPIIASLADGTVFLVDANRSRRASARVALGRLIDADAHIVGGVLNRFVPKNANEAGYYYAKDYYSYG